MKLIIGLGNLGRKYEKTRHNMGFMVVDCFRETNLFPEWEHNSKLDSLFVRKQDILLLKPQTFMNESGRAVGSAISYFQLSLDDVWIIYDDIDLVLGRIKVQPGGGGRGTHNGVKSVVNALGSAAFARFRVGIAGEDFESYNQRVIEYVISDFHLEELNLVNKITEAAVGLLSEALENGIDKTQSLLIK